MIDIFLNPVLWAAVLAWFAAQGVKFVWLFLTQRRFDLRVFLSTGGMPSAHSASVAATAWSVGLLEGFASPLFGLAAVFAFVVMFDAQGVRWAASRQARILNQLLDSMFQGQPVQEERLKELLGHTPFQVFAGALIGIIVAWLLIRTPTGP